MRFGSRAPRIEVPAGACDTHMHIYDASVAAAPGAPNPGDFPVSTYDAEIRQRLGITRTIVVQPNAYVDDNTVTLRAIAALGPGARGVGVVKPGVADAEIDRLTRGGIRAIRYMTLPSGALSWDTLDEMAARVHAFGWHVNLQLDGRTLPEREAQIRRLPGIVVVDHIGKYLEPVAPEAEAFKVLLRLLDTGRVYVKLSAPYETSKIGAPRYGDVGRLAKALVRAAPERMLWASNWPHPSAAKHALPDDADLIDVLEDWAPQAATRRAILVENPARLYGF
jgi:D-galactarolactone isomerase